MDTVDNLTLLLPRETKHLLKKLCSAEDYRYDLKDIEEFLGQQMYTNPYPTLQILKYHSTLNYSILCDIIYHGFAKFICEIQLNSNQILFNKFLNFLANFHIEDDRLKSACMILNEAMLHLSIDQRFSCYLSLLARSTRKLFIAYSDVSTQELSLASKAVILYYTLHRKEHIVNNLINSKFSLLQSTPYGQILAISKLVQELSAVNQPCKNNFELSDELLARNESIKKEPSTLLSILYYDLHRMANVFDMLKKYMRYELPLSSVITTQSILDLMLKQTKFTSIGFQTACSYAIKNQSCYNKMLKTNNHNIELNILVAHQVLAIICDVYFKTKKDSNYAKIVDNQMSVIVDSVRSLDDCQILVKLLENLFTMLFLRWEDVTESLGSDDIIDELMFDVSRDNGKCGFVCSKFLLEKILNVIRNTTNERLLKEDLQESLKQPLINVKRAVDDAFWRIQFLQKNHSDQAAKISIPIDSELIPLLFVFHTELLEQRSSDDEQTDETSRSNTLPRKKSKLKKRRNSVPASVLENYRLAPNVIRDANNGRVTEDKGIVAKMLGSPLDLAMIALSREDIEAAREIMNKFNLKDNTLEQDISFLENMRYIRSHLQKAISRYEEQESYLKSQSTIEHIKKVAAIGFETSRITNIIEEFTYANRVVPDSDSSNIVEKFCDAFPFLRQYANDKLQICVILDLILNLNMNHELSSNLWNMTNRLYSSENLLEELNNKDELYNGVGCVNFFNNIVQCMHLFKTISKENLGVKEIIHDTFFTLRSTSLKHELEKENTFMYLFQKPLEDVATIAHLKMIGKNFEEIKCKTNYFARFSRYIGNLLKLLGVISNDDCPENILEILNTNIKDTVGKILFEQQVSPCDIESLIYSLNLNLVHTIALNVCPVIKQNLKESTEKSPTYEFNEDEVREYISKYNSMLCYLLDQISGGNPDYRFMNSIYYKNAMNLPEVESLSTIYNNNLAVTTLLFDRLNGDQLRKIENKEQLVSIYKAARKKFDNSANLSLLKNSAIVSLIENNINHIKLLEYISDVNTRVETLLANIVKIRDADLAISLVKGILLDDNIHNISNDKKQRLQRYLKDIRIFSEAAKDFLFETWSGAYVFGEDSPELIMKKLIELRKYELCYEWWEQHNQINNLPLKSFRDLFFDSLVQTNKQLNPYLLKIIESFPVEQVVAFFETNIEKFKNLLVLKYVVNYLVDHNTDNSNNVNKKTIENNGNALKYQNFRVSLSIFDYMTYDECEQNWNLLSRPLLIIEQYVMNTKFEILSKILTSLRPLLHGPHSCKYCSDHMKQIYEIPMNSSITLGNPKNSAFILLNFNLYQSDHVITTSCIDILLQIYATKALDYRINEKSNSNDPPSLSTENASLDSLCGTFVMPKMAPSKDNWIKDDESMQCMCCKRAIFTMLTRRHHCRRCGRVVCYSCSTNRLKIPELYEDIPVRVCNDCFMQTQALEAKCAAKASSNQMHEKKKSTKNTDWQLSGNLTHDKLLREEFSYEHAPSSHLCLSILSFHSNNEEYVNLLLHHCRKFEKLLRPLREGYPNPEIDYALVAKMLNCLALAAKVRGGPPECDIVRDHSDIITAVVQNGCEALLPTETINNQSLRKLGDAVMFAEKWPLAIDIYLKCGYSTGAVLGAYGLACLRVGRYETAREQFIHCMTRMCKANDIANILKFITTEHELDVHSEIDIPNIKRSNRSPPLLDQIIRVIESTSRQVHVPETLARADSIRNSNTSLASTKSKPRDKIPILEPAMNIINTISNLKRISQGNYCDNSLRRVDNRANVLRKTQRFEECLYYLLAYGTHADIVIFLIRHDQTRCALRYFILQNLENDIFIKNIYVKHLKRGRVDYLIREMSAIDSQLSIWKDVIIQTCRYLETKNLLNCLYHLQILLNDPIRASMTCVKFYSMNCSSFRELQNNSFHLINAQKHLQSELEMCQWENINLNKKRPIKEPTFLMQMDAKTLNCHINTILRQMEVTKFLAKAEQDEKNRRSTRQILKQIGAETTTVPTLFDSLQERIQISILVLLCGNNIEEGFGLAYRIIQDYNLPSIKVYATTAKYLARNNRLAEVGNLISCIKSNNGMDQTEFDKILSLAVNAAINTHLPETKSVLDDLIKLITDVGKKISCHIYVGQLKSAYLLAVQHDRINDIMKILSQAEATNQIHIVRLCEKKLNINQK